MRGASRKLYRRASNGLERPIFTLLSFGSPEADSERAVLLADCPRASKAEALAQSQHGLEPLDGASYRGEGLKAASRGMFFLTPNRPLHFLRVSSNTLAIHGALSHLVALLLSHS